ncbi:nuclear transport factor 2 family protein [Ekhidna sp.]
MKKIFIIAIAFSVFSCSVEPSRSIVDGSDLEVLSDIQKNQWVRAYLNQDTVLLNQLLHEYYHLVDDNGDKYTKEDEMTYISNYAPSYSSHEYEIIEISLIDTGAASVIAKATLKGTDGAEAYITTYVSSTAFVKVDGNWQAISCHVSGVKEERFPMAPSE